METQVKQYIRQFHSVHLADITIWYWQKTTVRSVKWHEKHQNMYHINNYKLQCPLLLAYGGQQGCHRHPYACHNLLALFEEDRVLDCSGWSWSSCAVDVEGLEEARGDCDRSGVGGCGRVRPVAGLTTHTLAAAVSVRGTTAPRTWRSWLLGHRRSRAAVSAPVCRWYCWSAVCKRSLCADASSARTEVWSAAAPPRPGAVTGRKADWNVCTRCRTLPGSYCAPMESVPCSS